MAIDITRLSEGARAQIAAELARRAHRTEAKAPASPAPARVRGMNRWEQLYSEELSGRLTAGDITWFAYEPIRLRLAKATGYTPDFTVVLADGHLEFHEVKGFWRDDARVKIKVAAEMYPWARFVIVTRREKVFYKEVLCPKRST